MTHSAIAENLRRVRQRMATAATTAGRDLAEITLVGVTKYVEPWAAAALAAAGCSDLGESRPQELWRKAAAMAEELPSGKLAGPPGPPIRWHLVGHLQRNKIARTLPLVTLIHSVDSSRLLGAIDESAGRLDEAMDEMPVAPRPPVGILLEVNTSGESAKHGLAPDDIEPLLEAAGSYPHVAIRGLMTMAALDGGPAVAARNFATLRELRDRLRSAAPPGVGLDELSMGMSGDFEIAIREGATMVRIGSLLWENVDSPGPPSDNP